MQAADYLLFPSKVWSGLRRLGGAIRKFVRRNYNLMLDAAFWIQLYVQVKSMLQDASVLPIPLYPENELGRWMLLIQKALGYPAFFVLILLVILGSLRDEFSQKLWAKAATSFAAFAVVFPVLWTIGLKLRYPGLSKAWFETRPMANILPSDYTKVTDCVNLGYQQLEAINYAIISITDAIPLVLAGFYKWHRWRSGN